MEWMYVSEDVLLSVLQRRHDVQAPAFPLKSFPCQKIFPADFFDFIRICGCVVLVL